MTKSFDRREFLATAVASAAASAVVPLRGTAQPAPAEFIVVNGRVATLDRRSSRASALAMRGGRLIKVGSDEMVLATKGPSTRVVDLQGRTVIPGLNDSHLHFVRGGLSYNLDVRWDGVPTIALAMQKLSEQAARTPPGQWVRVGGGWSEYQFAEKRMPTLDELNKAVPDKPAYVLHFYESAMVNRVGLQAMGMEKAAKDVPGGVIVRDQKGRPTGMFLARPLPGVILAPESKMPSLSTADQRNSVQQFMAELNRLGLTSVVDPGGIAQPYPGMYGPLSGLAADRQLTLRVAMFFAPPTPGGELDDFKKLVSSIEVGGDDPWFRFVGGGELLENAAQDWDLYTTPRVKILKKIAPDMEAVARLLIERGWYLREHATQDNTASIYLGVLEKIRKDTPPGRSRFILDHAELASDRSLERLLALGGGVAVQHRAAFHGEYALRNYGPTSMRRAPPLRKMLDLGLPIGAGTDATRDTSYNPWVSIRWLVTGKTVGGTQLNTEENRLDRESALRLYTSGSAWISGQETSKGTLIEGQFADFAVLSADYFAVAEEAIADIESSMTVVDGRIVHASGPFADYAPAATAVTPAWSPAAFGAGYFRPA